MYYDRQSILNGQLANAIAEKDFERAYFLIGEGGDIAFEDNYLFIDAIINEDVKIVNFLLNNHVDISIDNFYCIRDAAIKGNVELLKLYIEHGFDINTEVQMPSDKLKMTALTYTAMYGSMDALKYLVSNNAEKSIFDNRALKEAAKRGHLDIVRYLVVECDQDMKILNNIGIQNNIKDWLVQYEKAKELKEGLENNLNQKSITTNKVKI